MSTYFNGANSNTYSSYYGPGGSVTIAEGVAIGGSNTISFAVSMAGEGTVENLGALYGFEAGIDLADGGTITNGSASDLIAEIEGFNCGIILGATGVIENCGAISGFQYGISAASGGTIINEGLPYFLSGIGGNYDGIKFSGSEKIFNYGNIISSDEISNSKSHGVGIYSQYGELYLVNGNENDLSTIYPPSIYGSKYGIFSDGAVIYNYGEIRSPGAAIDISDHAVIRNSGTIYGDIGILSISGNLSIYNSGVITVPSNPYAVNEDGIDLGSSGASGKTTQLIENKAYAIIKSPNSAIYFGSGTTGTVINYGTIITYNRYFSKAIDFNNEDDVLVIEGGSEIRGGVLGGGGTLELGSGGGAGTISAGPSFYTDFSKYIVQSGADWLTAGTFTIGDTAVFADYGTLSVGGEIDALGGTLQISETLVDTGTLTATTSGVVTNDGLLKITQGGLVDIGGTLTGDGIIELSDQGTLELFGRTTGALVDFADSTGTLSLADPLGLGVRIEGFQQGDVIDLPGVSDIGTASLSYANGLLSVVENGALVAELSLTNVAAGTLFGLQGDHHGGMEVVIWSVPNVLPAAQLGTLENGIIALGRDVAETQDVTDPSLNVFTSKALLNPSGGPVKGDINIADGKPDEVGETITLGPKVQGIVLTGQHRAAEIVGHAANAYAATELLVGNNGNDTILGGGGSGTIIAGSGQNQIETGSGNMLVSSSGTDQIDTGTGDDTVYAGGVAWVTAQGNATVHGGAGFTTFTDAGTTTSAEKVKGGSGTTIMNSGLGQDTFVGGSGTSFMNDTGPGRVALVFNKGTGGSDIVTGFDPANGDYIRTTAASNGWADFQNNISVIGGSSFVNLADGTKIEFVGFTSLSAADFHA